MYAYHSQLHLYYNHGNTDKTYSLINSDPEKFSWLSDENGHRPNLGKCTGLHLVRQILVKAMSDRDVRVHLVIQNLVETISDRDVRVTVCGESLASLLVVSLAMFGRDMRISPGGESLNVCDRDVRVTPGGVSDTGVTVVGESLAVCDRDVRVTLVVRVWLYERVKTLSVSFSPSPTMSHTLFTVPLDADQDYDPQGSVTWRATVEGRLLYREKVSQ
ncbi:hypothetical protein J6590_097515 [Homalodisca vitripennis]|nr:hypothetical protein J6590_097515 [Homalodisca vitripennis]